MEESIGPMMDFVDNFPPQLIYYPEDKDTFIDKLVGDDTEDESSSEQSDADELARLYDLKEKGAITQEEYETLKAKVINKQ